MKNKILAIMTFSFFVSLYSLELFACPSGQSCPAGKDCVADSSLCVADSSSSSATSSEPTTTKDQLGLTLNPDFFRNSLQPSGMPLTYSNESLPLNAALLPATIEGGTPSDEANHLVFFRYGLESASKGSIVGALIHLDAANSPVPKPSSR